jgi:hypothetical protein
LLALPAASQGQPLLWGGVGQNTETASGLTSGENAVLGIAFSRPTRGMAATVGVPLDSDSGSRWGALAGWAEHRPGAGPWGVAGAGTLFAYADPILDRSAYGSVITVDGFRLVPVDFAQLRLRVGLRHGSHLGGDEDSQRLLGRAGSEVVLQTGMLDLRGELDHWRAGEGGYTQTGVRLTWLDPRFQAWAAASRWLDADLDHTGWELGARVPLTPRLAAIARGGVQPPDILFLVDAQRNWSVGFEYRTGRDPLLAALPVPVVLEDERPLRLTLPDGRSGGAPGVAGTFSRWQIIPMRPVEDGWELELVLEPGVHEYSFVTADGQWFVPEGTPGRRPDGFGGWVAVVVVQ